MIRSMRFDAGRVVVWPLVVLVVLVLSAISVLRTQIPKEETLQFRPIRKDTTLLALGQRYLQNEIDDNYALYEHLFRGKSDVRIIRENTFYIRVDLNRDGVPEIFLQLGLMSHCGTAGCETILLRRQNGVWQEVYNLQANQLTLLDEWDGPYRRVQFGDGYNTQDYPTRLILRWDGDHPWTEERDMDGNTVEEYRRHPQPQPTPQE